MLDQTGKKKPDDATRTSVEKDMAEPRMAKSARILDSPTTSMPGTVAQIIPALGSHRSEKAQIVIEGTGHLRHEIRIDNTLQTADGDDVSLKVGSKVEVKIELRNPQRRGRPRERR
jgi:hypothetical protein